MSRLVLSSVLVGRRGRYRSLLEGLSKPSLSLEERDLNVTTSFDFATSSALDNEFEGRPL